MIVDQALGLTERGLGWSQARLADALRTTRFLRGRRRFRPREDDVYVVTYPRSGTTWVQFILYLLSSDRRVDFAHLSEVSPWWERTMALGTRRAEDFEALPGPRVFKSHLPRRWLPDRGRFIYIQRDGLDVAVSYYHLYRSHLGFEGDLEAFFERFLDGDLQYGSWFKHVAGWRRHFDDPRVLHLQYEALRADPRSAISRIATFLGWGIPEGAEEDILEKASFGFMKGHEEKFDPITETLIDQGLHRGRFIREGRSGSGLAVSEALRARFRARAASSPRFPEVELKLPAFLH